MSLKYALKSMGNSALTGNIVIFGHGGGKWQIVDIATRRGPQNVLKIVIFVFSWGGGGGGGGGGGASRFGPAPHQGLGSTRNPACFICFFKESQLQQSHATQP